MKTGKLHLLQMCSSLLATTVYSVVIVTQVPLDFDYLVPFFAGFFAFSVAFYHVSAGVCKLARKFAGKPLSIAATVTFMALFYVLLVMNVTPFDGFVAVIFAPCMAIHVFFICLWIRHEA